jgi:hypothetical protein
VLDGKRKLTPTPGILTATAPPLPSGSVCGFPRNLNPGDLLLRQFCHELDQTHPDYHEDVLNKYLEPILATKNKRRADWKEGVRDRLAAEPFGDAYKPNIPPQIYSYWLFVTPIIAKFLFGLSLINRSEVRAKQYTQEILAGEWELNHQGCAFDVFGNYRDGHNRALGIVRAGKGIWLYITFNNPVRGLKNMDTGRPRNKSDSLAGEGLQYTAASVAIGKAMYQTGQSNHWTELESLRFMTAHGPAISFVNSLISTKKRGIKNAPVQGPIARAVYTLPPETVEDFISVLVTSLPVKRGDADPVLKQHQTIAIQLRDWLLTKRKGGASPEMREDCFLKCSKALAVFAGIAEGKTLVAAKHEYFPIPSLDEMESGEWMKNPRYKTWITKLAR